MLLTLFDCQTAGLSLEPLDSSGKNKQTKISKQKSSSKKIQSWGPLESRPLALGRCGCTHTHTHTQRGCFEECEPCFGVDSFSPGRGLEPLSFMEVLNPFSSSVLHHSSTERKLSRDEHDTRTQSLNQPPPLQQQHRLPLLREKDITRARGGA